MRILSSLIVMLLISACGSSAPQPTAPVVPSAKAGNHDSTAAPPTTVSPSPGALRVKTWTETNGFRKSEARYFAATGRPQFVEFFAFW